MTPTLSTLPDSSDLLAAADAARHLGGSAAASVGTAARPADAGGADLADAAIDAALQVQARINALRLARGEIPLGYKIGFTNRTIWPLYGVHHPIWGPVWSTTVTRLDGSSARLAASRWIEPRLEPQIVIGLRASPEVAAAGDNARLIGCIDWVAHGFEIVQSVYPGWKFDAAQAIAAQALHGALLIGPRVPVAALGPAPDVALATLRLSLSDGDRLVAEGVGSNVLDGPVQALGHLVAELGRRGERLAAGAIITTGTLTDAQPLAAGQRWRTRIEGVPLQGLRLEVE
jgi:2-oxo-3-hexenedioate decarboxylase